MTHTKSARVGGKYKYVGGKWKMRVFEVWVVNGRTNIFMKTNVSIILMLMNIPVL